MEGRSSIPRISCILVLATMWTASSCRSEGEARARAMCEKAESLERTNPRSALRLRALIQEEASTAGTASARACLAPIRERMGRVRVLVSEDERGETETVEACSWAADAVEAFGQSVNPPFKRAWARRLLERCSVVVGRAWSRNPDDPDLMALGARLDKLSR